VRAAERCLVCGQPPPFREIFARGPYRLASCPTCGLVFQDPQPGDEILDQAYYYDPEFTSALLGPYRKRTLDLARGKLRLLEATAGPLRPGRALDVGCSTGAWLEVSAARGWSSTGIEPSPSAAQAARARGLDARTGTLEELAATLGDQSFDLITFWDVLEHLHDPRRELLLARRLLAPQGVLAATMPNVAGWYPRITFRLIGTRTGVWEHPEMPVHLFDFSPATISRLLTGSGYRLKGIKTRPVPYSHYRATTLSAEALGRRRRRWLLRAAFGALHLTVYPVAGLFDRSNGMGLAAVRSDANNPR
jgi:SAM-dependent methyltransferase